MKLAVVLLALVLGLATTFAAEDSRGDTFEDLNDPATTLVSLVDAATTFAPVSNTISVPTVTATTPPPTTTRAPTLPPDPAAAPCSGRPFDAFLQLKNGSIYAFRGHYFFELDEKAVLPGYPKRIEDVWGISGPIDAAFTRINCQGKTYIFKGNQYWRFDGDDLDDDYPRDISVGFEKIPDNVDAAFAIPAPSHNQKEKVYFFKGDQYYHYEFKHQPSHDECVHMTKSSPSVLFTQYTDLYCDSTWEGLFTALFGGSFQGHHKGPHFIRRDWIGIRPPIDAAMVGRIYLNPQAPTSLPIAPPPRRRRVNRKRRPNRRQRSRDSFFLSDLWSFDDMYTDYGDYSDDILDDTTTQQLKGLPVQNVFFFKKDKYYRVDLQTKRVDFASPPYPRSIAKYWLGCRREESPDESRAEKR
ncbi:vitronectin b isoform X2 [Lampris incognitus]|uniref:vitronectin b isoform X2 n=1 Tax=Lampris incognitus TaxID=2546036 RepID=UPI0024B55D7E|nr:vitronectin b isoform X2 [Lampris incognitus]